ncbi:MAG: I78 family peptidase inhibitor [Pacificimonas sp.]
MKTFAIAALLAASATAAPAFSAHHETVTAADAAKVVDNPDRLDYDRNLDGSRLPARALAFMRLEAGDRVLDMFAGGGYYTELMARAVGADGFVLAQNPPSFAARDTIQEALEYRRYGDRVKNAAALNTDFMSLPLAPNSIDNVLFHLVYHDLYFESAELGLPRSDAQVVLAKIHKALRPGATVTVIDHVGDGADARADVKATHRIAPAIVARDFEQAGFKLLAQESFFDNPEDDHAKSVFDPALRGKTDRFAMRFGKAGDPNSAPAVALAETDIEADVAEYGAGECDAGPLSAMVGKALNMEGRAEALAKSGAKTLRVYSTGDAVTQDYRTDRLNIEMLPNSDEVAAVSCG